MEEFRERVNDVEHILLRYFFVYPFALQQKYMFPN